MAGMPPIAPYPMPTPDALPGNTPGWAVERDRAVLLIHDMQHYFIEPFSRTEAPLRDLVGNIALLRESCGESVVPVAYTAQPGGMNAEERGLLKDFWGPGMGTEPAGREIVPSLAPATDDWVFTKWRYSAFHRSGLLERMRAHGRDQLIVCGVYAHIGVLMTAVEAFSNDIEVFLVADAVADFSEEYHHLALSYAAQRCAVVATTEAIVGRIAATG